MSTDRLKGSGATQAAQQALPGNATLKNQKTDESALVNLYMEITQETEAQARSVFMFVISDNEESCDRLSN